MGLSIWAWIYFFASVLIVFSRTILEAAIAGARQTDARRQAVGFDQAALDDSARLGFANGAFEESEEEPPAIVEKFYAQGGGSGAATDEGRTTPAASTKPSPREKLNKKAARHAGEAG